MRHVVRSGVHTSPRTRIEITCFGALHRMCPTDDPCGVSQIERITCPRGHAALHRRRTPS